MTLAELRDADAPPDIAAIYAALRTATGVPLVNLIWRHLATLPGVLPWAWQAVRPALEAGSVAAARTRIAQALDLPEGLRRVDEEAWQSAGLPAAARDPVLAILDTYNRGNLTNLVVLTALRRSIEGEVAQPDGPPPAAAPADTAPLAPVPPLPVLEGLPGETRALVERLAARHAGAAAGGVTPSLYLHLAHWPALLAALPGWIGPLLDRLDESRAAAIDAAAREAAALRPRPEAGAGAPGGQGAAVLAALTRFTTQVIPDMVPVGLALRRALGQG